MPRKYEHIGKHLVVGARNSDSHNRPPTEGNSIPLDKVSSRISEEHSVPPRPKGHRERCIRLTQSKPSAFWTWEIAASVFSIFALAAVVVVLLYENGKPLDNWNILIPPNAVISFLTTLVKSSCVLVLAEMIGQLRWFHFTSGSRIIEDLQGAITSAVYGIPLEFMLTCPALNCTFPAIETIGVCTSCQNATTASSIILHTPLDTNEEGFFRITTPNNSVASVVIDLPNGYMAGSLGDFGTALISVPDYIVSPDTQETPSVPIGRNAVIAALTTIKVNLDVLTAYLDYSGLPSYTGQNYTEALYDVAQCELAYCMRTFSNITVQNSATQQGSSEDSLLEFVGPPYMKDPESSIGGRIMVPLQAVESSSGKPGMNVTMSFTDYQAIAAYMYNIFNSSSFNLLGIRTPANDSLMTTFAQATLDSDKPTLSTMLNIADHMTTAFRAYGINTTTVNGTALVNEVYISIEWKWLAMPISICLLSSTLLVVVILRSQSRGIEAWKSSSMPLLFYQLEGWDPSMCDFQDADEMMWKSRRMKGRLLLDGKHRVIQREDDGGLRHDGIGQDPTQGDTAEEAG